MAAMFSSKNIKNLFGYKCILIIGDSNYRRLYKDIVQLIKCNKLICNNDLRKKVQNFHIEYIFITRCYSNKVKEIFEDIHKKKRIIPDVVLMSSILWDIVRWGPNGVNEFKENMRKLMQLVTSTLPQLCLFIWGTGTPTAQKVYGGLIIKQIEFLQDNLRFDILEANQFCKEVVSSYGLDILDFHYYMQLQIIRRSPDGAHFMPLAVRYMTNLFLTHIALSWDIELPRTLSNKNFALPEEVRLSKMNCSNEIPNLLLMADRLKIGGKFENIKKVIINNNCMTINLMENQSINDKPSNRNSLAVRVRQKKRNRIEPYSRQSGFRPETCHKF